MNKTHQKTFEALFSVPVISSLEWRRIEMLFIALGARVIEGNGSRVNIHENNEL